MKPISPFDYAAEQVRYKKIYLFDGRDVFQVIVYGTEIDDKPDIIFCKKVICFALCFRFAGKEAGADVLDVDLKILWNSEYLLLGELVTDLLV